MPTDPRDRYRFVPARKSFVQVRDCSHSMETGEPVVRVPAPSGPLDPKGNADVVTYETDSLCAALVQAVRDKAPPSLLDAIRRHMCPEDKDDYITAHIAQLSLERDEPTYVEDVLRARKPLLIELRDCYLQVTHFNAEKEGLLLKVVTDGTKPGGKIAIDCQRVGYEYRVAPTPLSAGETADVE